MNERIDEHHQKGRNVLDYVDVSCYREMETMEPERKISCQNDNGGVSGDRMKEPEHLMMPGQEV